MWVGLIGLAIGLIALVEKGMETRTHVLWLRESDRASNAFGPFVNGNHGHAFINLTFPILCYLLWRQAKNTHKVPNKIGMWICAMSLLAFQAALVISGSSRGNFLFLAALPLALLVRLGLSRKSGTVLAAAAGCAALLGAALFFIIRSGLLVNEVRIATNSNIISHLYIAGNGLGTFPEVFPAEITDWPMFQSIFNAYLENEYLQLYFEIGAVSFLIAGGMLVYLAIMSFRALLNKGTLVWIVAPVAAEAARAWVDMNFHIMPLVAAFLLLCAIILSRRR